MENYDYSLLMEPKEFVILDGFDDNMVIAVALCPLQFRRAKLIGNVASMDDAHVVYYEDKKVNVVFNDTYEYRTRYAIKRELERGNKQPYIAKMSRNVPGHSELDVDVTFYPKFDEKTPFKKECKRVLLRSTGFEPVYNGFKMEIRAKHGKMLSHVYQVNLKTFFKFINDAGQKKRLVEDIDK